MAVINIVGEILVRYYLIAALIAVATVSSVHAGYREAFEKEFLYKSWGSEETEVNACVKCHSSDIMKPEFQNITQEWKMSWHSQNNVMCNDCHGGDSKDATMSMSHQRGFAGSPKKEDIPEFCGRCHIGILRNYLDSGHGKSLQANGSGPTCVTCHGSHNIQKASIDIINEGRCTKCHSYERARGMKQALFATENYIRDIEKKLEDLTVKGMYVGHERRDLFSTQAEFRTLFHTIDATLVKLKTDNFTQKLIGIDVRINDLNSELRFRRDFAVYLMLIFLGLSILVYFLSKPDK